MSNSLPSDEEINGLRSAFEIGRQKFNEVFHTRFCFVCSSAVPGVMHDSPITCIKCFGVLMDRMKDYGLVPWARRPRRA